MKTRKSMYGTHITIYEIDKNREIDKLDFVAGYEPTETLESFYSRQARKPNLLINGGFFYLQDGKPVFNFIDEGVVIAEDVLQHTEGVAITKTGEILFCDILHLERNEPSIYSNIRDFVSGYPTLIRNGLRVNINYAQEINYNAPRTIIGFNEATFFVVTIDAPGANFKLIQDICQEVGMKWAINLDGGGSTRCLLNGVRTTKQVYSRPVDNFVALYLKEIVDKIYRVQVGAWKSKELADRFLSVVRAIPDEVGAGYAESYVRYIDGWYKIQVGAFRNKDGAARVYDDLISKGYKAIIV